jgi:uncharacterized repeat protein (TIGR01451 family)
MAREENHNQLCKQRTFIGHESGTRQALWGRSAFIALLISSILIFAGVLVAGQNLQVTGVSGVWDNTVDTDGGSVDGEGTASIRWGTPATYSGRSGYDFDAAAISSIGPGAPIVIGQFTHLNFPIYPPSLESAELVITIEFNDPRLTSSEIEITVPFTHDETGNGEDPCDYPDGPNQNGCADAVFIGTVASDLIVVGGIECEVTVWFGNGTNRYLTAEEEENEIDLYLQFSCPSFSPLLTIEKSGPANANIGDTVTYSFDVTHAVTSDGSPVGTLSVTDSVAGNASLTGKTGGDQDDYLEDGETWSYEATYTIQPDDENALINEGCVEGLDIDNDIISDCDTHTTTVPHAPLLLVQKSGLPTTANVGDTVNYTVTVQHKPSSDGSPVDIDTVADSLGISLTLASGDDGDGLLESSETWIYTGSREVLPADPVSLTNEVCISGDDLDGDTISNCDSTTTTIVHDPALLVLKTGQPTATVGDTITYTITVQHHVSSDGSPIDITNVEDSLIVSLTGPTGDDGDGWLQENETWTYTATRAVEPTDLNELINTFCASGVDLDGDAISDCDSTTTIVEHAPLLLVQKSGLPTTASVGNTVDYTVTVEHAPGSDGSPVDITDVNDSLGIILSGPSGDDGDGLLEDGETWTYTGSRVVLPADPADLINEVCVRGDDLDGDAVEDCDSTTTIIEHAPVLLVQKDGVPSIANVGNTIAYLITVRHDPSSDNSPVDITNVNDSLGIILSGPSGDDGDDLLEAGEVWTYTGSREILPSDPASLTNEVCVDGIDLDGDAVSDCGDTTTTVRHAPVIVVEKTGDPVAAAVGDTVDYTITVQHAGASDGSPVDITSVNDSLGIALSGPTGDDGDSWLEDGEVWTYVGSRVVLVSDPHLLTNTVCAEGLDLDGDAVEDCDSTTTTISHPDIDLVKDADVATASIGDTITYTYTVENTGDVDLYSVVLDDNILGIIAGPASGDDGDSVLETDETWIYTKTHLFVEGDLPGPLVNVATVAGTPLVGSMVTDTDSASVQLTSHPSIDLVKTASTGATEVGDTITYTYDITNTGDVTLTSITLNDDVLGPITPAKTTLAPGEPTTGTATHVVTQQDLDAGEIVNVATVTGTPPTGPDVTDNDTETVSFVSEPSIEIVKTASAGTFLVGETITYTYVVTNTGNVSLTGITISDDILGPITLATTTLAPTISTTGQATHVVTQQDIDAGQIFNVATVTGTPPSGPSVSNQDDETVSFTPTPSIKVVKTAAGGPFLVNQSITYSYVVTNTGNVTLTGITLSDDVLGPIALAATTLAPTATTTGSATHVVTQADIDAGEIVNIATVTGTPPSGSNVTDDDTETVSFVPAPNIEVVKTASDGPFLVGETITYNYLVTNTGNVTLTGIVLNDDILGPITLATTTLAPTISTTGQASHVVTQSDVDAGEIVNIATATGTPPSGPNVSGQDDETVEFTPNPGIKVVKTASDGPFEVNDIITYDYVITNIGNVTLTGITLSDDILGPITLATTTLAPTISTTGQATHVVTQADIDAGSIVNIASVTGTPPNGPNVTDDDTKTVLFAPVPNIEVVKTASDGPFLVGETITYNYVVTNTGNVTLTGIVLNDDILGPITLTATTLAPSISATGTATHVVTQADIDAAQIINIATVTGTPPNGPNVSDQDDETVDFTSSPGIEVIKTVADGPKEVGDTLTYNYTVTNTGNVTLTGIVLNDDILGPITLTATTLAPSISATGTATHVVTQDDIDAGSIVNIATAIGIPPSGPNISDQDDETVTFGQTPAIKVVKTAAGGSFELGDTITYNYTVTNIGAVTLTGITLDDNILGPITLVATTLAPSISTTGQATHVVTQDDIDAGGIVNIATVIGTPPSGPDVSSQDDETVTFVPMPNIEVVKTASDGPFLVGETVTYDYVVTNTGNVTLTGIVLSDDILGPITLIVTTLAPTITTTGQATHVVTQDDVDAGQIVNIATVTGTPPSGPDVTDDDDETVAFTPAPSIEVVKTAANGPFLVGQTITYTYDVTNTGNVTLTGISLVDDILGSISLGETTLAPTASTTGTSTHLVTQQDVDSGEIVNIGTVTGTPPSGSDVTDQDDETVSFNPTPNIEVIKTAANGPFLVGQTITYNYVVTNTGNVTLTGIVLNDDILGPITLIATTLAPTITTTGQATHVVTQDDVDAGQIVNIATVTGTPPSGPDVTDDDDETVTFTPAPSIEVVKTASDGPFLVGETVTYDYLVTNTGNVTLTGIVLNDDILGPITLIVTTLAPTISTTGQATHVVTQDDVDAGQIVNIATVTGTPPSGPNVTDDDTATVSFVPTPNIEVVKTASDGPFLVGETVTYDYLVTNTGNVTLTGIVLNDDILGPITLIATTLAPTITTTGQATHVVTQDDVDAGQIVNIATVTGTPPSGPDVTDDDDETVTFGQTPAIEVIKNVIGDSFVLGDTITYSYTVTNIGGVTLTGIVLNDDILGPITLIVTTLAPTISTTGQATHVVTQDDVDAGQIVNIATVTGTPPSGPNVTDDDTATVSFVPTPNIKVVKTASDGPFLVGQTVTYNYVVTNTGNVTLTGIVLNDDILGPITLIATTLAPTISTTGQATHVVTQDDVDAGQIVNIATVTGTPPSGPDVTDDDDETVTFIPAPNIEIVKTASDGPFLVGEAVTYDYLVTNTGNVTLTGIVLNDDILGPITLAATTLAPTISTTGQATHVVTQDDVDAGQIVNIATVTGTPPSGPNVTDDDTATVTFVPAPNIEILKTASDGPFLVGETVTYDYLVTNTGNVTLTGIVLNDDILGPITLIVTTLAPTISTTGQATHVVTQDDVDAGQIVNIATVTGTPPSGPYVTDDDDETVTFGQTPAIEVIKNVIGDSFVLGDTITYSYTVTNIGGVTLTGITLDDDVLGPITLIATTLAPTISTTGQATHVVTQDDVDAGQIVNIATVTGTPPSGPNVTDNDTATVSFVPTPNIEVVKTASDGPFLVGETVTYDYLVTNTGNVTLTGIVLDDDILGPITLAATTLAPTISTTGQATHVVTQDDVDAGQIVNIATVTGTPPSSPNVSDQDDATVTFGQTPAIEVIKSVIGGPFVLGDTITYSYTVTNIGGVTLTGIVLNDDVLGPIALAATTLAPTISTTSTAAHVVTQDDVDAGEIVNIATVTGTPPSGPNVTDDDDEIVTFTPAPSIEVVKTAANGPFLVGETVTYDYVVTNTGNVTLTGIVLSDDILGPIALAATTLAPTISTTGQATHVVTQNDVDASEIVNIATVTATPPSGPNVTDDDDEIVTFTPAPSIEVVKTAATGTFVLGDSISYDYVVTNTGNVTLTGIVLNDDILGPIALVATTLAPTLSTTGQATHVVTQADIDSGAVINIATATGTPPSGPNVSDTDTETVPFVSDPSIEIIKVAVGGPFAVTETITYNYTITNTGNVTLIGIIVADDKLGTISLSSTTLIPGASTAGTATHVVTQQDVDTGEIVNIATATGTPPTGPVVTDDDDETVVFVPAPNIEVVKTASTGPFVAGDTVTYTYTVSNIGNVTLTGITLTDDKLGPVTLAATSLAPTASTTATAPHVVTQSDIDGGSIVNVATVTGTPPSGPNVTDQDDETVAFDQTPAVEVVKTVAQGPTAVGDTITYNYTVTNTGGLTLTGITLADDKLGPITLVATTLAPTISTTGQATHVVTQADVDAGQIVNIATVTGTPPTGPDVTDDDDEIVTFTPAPSIEVVKTAATGTFVLGDSISYDYLVTNTGNVTLTGIVLNDDILGPITLVATTLAPTISTTGQATHVVTQADVDAGQIVNIATVTGTPPSGPNVTDDDDETVTFTRAPSLVIVKIGDVGPVRVGETINYQIAVTNNGNVTLHNVIVTDPLLGITQNLGTFVPGQSQIVTSTYGPVDNSDLPGPLVNIASADSDETTPVDDDHSVEILPIGIDLSLVKTVDNINPEIGELVTFEITITNSPNYADATNVDVTDTLPDGYAFAGFSVTQGSYTYGGLDSVWEVGDLLAGESATLQVFATVLADGSYVSPAEVTAADQDDIDSVPANADLLAEDDDDEATVFIDTPIADLLVIKSVDNATPNEEEIVVFTVSVYNGGPYTSTGIVLQDALPAGLTYVSDTSGGAYSPATNAWDVGDLIVGASASFTMSVRIDIGTAGTTIINTALVVANEIDDPSPANNEDSADVTIGELTAGGGGTDDECDGKVIISEIAWAGTAADANDEWIELRNIGGEPVDLTGWVLRWRKKQPVTPEDFEWKIVQLSGVLQPSTTPVCELADLEPEPAIDFVKREVDDVSWFVVARPIDFDESYLLLERGSDLTVSNIDADIVYDDLAPYAMELSDEGDIIELVNADGIVTDTANAFPSYEGNWPAGDLLTQGTMERIDLLGPDEPENWHTNLGIITRGVDANGRPLIASADVMNSQTLAEMELFIDLNAVKTLPGARLEVGLDLSRETRRETGWPWIRITRPGEIVSADIEGGGGQYTDPVYSFASRYANDTYWLGIDTAGLTPGDYLVWVVYGEGETVLVPITILQ